eukprot:Tbor_TRINITY_DN4324_c0_g1::TRINITY_DN4324_c0_g1_i1::g.7642::m.7642/K01916/nadE; NAD+ synthase
MSQPSSPSLHPSLQAKLEEYRTTKNFNPRKWIETKCNNLNNYMRINNLKCCITSVSGGIDSAVTLSLCAKAREMDNSPIIKNIGICQPIKSSPWALKRGKENIGACKATEIIIDQSQIFNLLKDTVDSAINIKGGGFAAGQLKSYMRTPAAYYTAQLLSQEGLPTIIMGTGNKDEDGYLGYFCKAGDGVTDINIISDLHKSEVYLVAKELGTVPINTINAEPSADLWEGQSDEEELGFPYSFVEMYTGWYLLLGNDKKVEFKASLCEEGLRQFVLYEGKVEGVHRRNRHKIDGAINL